MSDLDMSALGPWGLTLLLAIREVVAGVKWAYDRREKTKTDEAIAESIQRLTVKVDGIHDGTQLSLTQRIEEKENEIRKLEERYRGDMGERYQSQIDLLSEVKNVLAEAGQIVTSNTVSLDAASKILSRVESLLERVESILDQLGKEARSD